MYQYEVRPRNDHRGIDLIPMGCHSVRCGFRQPHIIKNRRVGWDHGAAVSPSVIERCGMRRIRGDLRLRRAQRKRELAIRERELRVCHL